VTHRELHHRTQNLFAVVQSIFNRTYRVDTERKQQFISRLHALAAANALAADAAWEGVRLDQLIRAELAGFTDRATVTGCDLLLSPLAAQSFALIVHELATNASKYGALSVAAGNLTVQGKTGRSGEDMEDVFNFCWSEWNGPEVLKPSRRGFGSTVLLDAVKTLGGEAQIDYAPAGVRYELSIRLAAIQVNAQVLQRATANETRSITN
jgi:two-component sensor histidine kinase